MPHEEATTLYDLWFRLNRAYEVLAAEGDLPLSQRYVLYLLEGGPLTQRQMRSMTLWPKQTTNAVVKALERRGWVSLETCEADRRSKEVRLTKAGAKAAARFNHPVRKAESAAVASLGEKRLAAMLNALDAYVSAMETEISKKE